MPATATRDQATQSVRRLPLAIGAAALLLCVLAVAEAAATAPADARFDRAVIEALIVGVPIAVRLCAIRSRRARALRRDAPRRRRDLVADGARRVVGEPALQHRARVAWLIFPLLFYLMLAYPDGRLAGRSTARSSAARRRWSPSCSSARRCSSRPIRRSTRGRRATRTARPTRSSSLDAEPAVMDAVVTPLRELLACSCSLGDRRVAGSLATRVAAAIGRRIVAR